jgi:RIO-like serine/threonine protein kinase
LKAIHKAGVLHGDIRTSNLCVSETREAFVIDFSHAMMDDDFEDDEARNIAYFEEISLFREKLQFPERKRRAKQVVASGTEMAGVRRSPRLKAIEQKALRDNPRQKSRGKQTSTVTGKTTRK